MSILQGLPPLTYDLAYAAGDDHARELAMQLRAALANAGWTCAATAEVPAPPKPLAIFLPKASPGSNALVTWARRANFDPDVRMAPRMPRMRIVIGR